MSTRLVMLGLFLAAAPLAAQQPQQMQEQRWMLGANFGGSSATSDFRASQTWQRGWFSRRAARPNPLWLRAGAASFALRAEDGAVREKRFAFHRERIGAFAGRGAAELIHEEAASRFGPTIETNCPSATAMETPLRTGTVE